MAMFLGYLWIGLFLTIHIVMYRSFRRWLFAPHPDFPKDYPLPAWVHLVIAVPAAGIAALVTWIAIVL